MASVLSIVVIIMGIRLYVLHRREIPTSDGRNTLLKYYLVFTLGYILRAISAFF